MATIVLVLVCSYFVSNPEAWADQTKPDYVAAKAHYTAAEKAAKAQDWSTAAKEYGVAYEITRDPVLFFKLGNAYQLSGDCTRAVEYYERYIAEAKPSQEYETDTKSRIAKCNAAGRTATGDETAGTGVAPVTSEPAETADGTSVPGLEENQSAGEDLVGTDDESVGQPTFFDDEPTWQETAGWTSVGVTVAFLSASAILGLSANSREEDIDNLISYRDMNGNPAEFDETIQKRYDTLADEGEDLNTLSLVALSLAGVSAASAIVFFVLDSSNSAEEEGLSTITPTITKESLGVAAGWAF
jgi:hypothetical protein